MTAPARARIRLWMKLAAFAAVGVVAMHAIHLFIGVRVATRALASEEARLGAKIGHIIARQAVDPILLNDLVSLYDLVQTAIEPGIEYCLIVRDGRVMASSFEAPAPPKLVALRGSNEHGPLVVRTGRRLVLDVAEPILGGQLGHVRLGLDMSALDDARHALALRLGLLALVVIAAGLVAAFVAGRSVARPIDEILAAADRFDPAAGGRASEVRSRGSDEIAVLADRFNRMMRRLEDAHAEQTRARQRAVETERLAAMGSLVAGVAHEVNNPLAGLKNCVRRLERADLPDAKRREYLALMEEGLVRIEEVVRQLLDFGRPHPPRLEPIAASRLAHETMALLRPKLARRRVRLELIGDDALALADRRPVGQALVNLLLNAGYVTPNGGEIRIRIRRRDGFVGVAVEDDGPGIPEEIRDRVVDPFFSTKPEGQGTGLGLSVTRTIIDQHGGELTFEFPPDGGTIATVWLRAAVPASEPATA
jgi:two-component system NtrC family sensor kinase